jgi:copper type II ascorbate-dependent monooxygenase-like protein
MSKYTALAFGLLFAATGCGSVTDQPTGTTSGGGGAGGTAGSGTMTTGGSGTTTGSAMSTGTGSTLGDSFSVEFGPVTIAPGKENTQCVLVRLDNPALLHVGQIHNELSQGSHHLIVYRTNDTEEKLTPYDCQPFSDLLKPEKGSPLMVTQKHDDLLTLPQGVAFSFQPKQMLRLEMHYINTGNADLQVHAKSTVTGILESEFKDEADFLFLGDPDIKVPAHGKQTLGPVYLALQAEQAGAKVFGITGHTHQWGTNVTVTLANSKDDPGTVLYDVPGWLWSEPATVKIDPPVQIPAGGGFRFTCDYDNKGNTDVKFGESANDEMCFFWAYYYPSKGAYVCAHTDQFGSIDICCPGNPLCSKLLP